MARLRDCTCIPHGEICREAADEIERLRERVRIYEGVMRNAKRDIDSLKQQMEDMEARRG